LLIFSGCSKTEVPLTAQDQATARNLASDAPVLDAAQAAFIRRLFEWVRR
jgi:hypothetical protein